MQRLFNVLLAEPISVEGIEILRQKCTVDISPGPHVEQLASLIDKADALLVRGTKVSASLIAAAKRLKVIGRHGIGVDNIDVAAATKSGIAVVNTPETNVNAVAEHTIWGLLHCARNFNKAEKALRKGEFSPAGSLPAQVQGMGFSSLELKEKKLGLVGLGKIAGRVAKIAGSAFDMKLLAYDPYVSDKVFASLGVMRAQTLEYLLSVSDFVSLHVPLTDSTRCLIGARELSYMKKSSFLINNARGGIVDEDALCKALLKGGIAGALLDVCEQEPPPKGSALFGMENLMLTPHMAAMSDLALVNMAKDVATGILDVLEGRPPGYIVNPEVLNNERSENN